MAVDDEERPLSADGSHDTSKHTVPEQAVQDADVGAHAGEGDSNIEREDVHSFEIPDADLPPLPTDDEGLSLAEVPSDLADSAMDSDTSAMLERDMRRDLLDMESSFLPDISTASAAAGGTVGADDTFLFGGSPGHLKEKDLIAQFAKSNTIAEHPAESEEEEDTARRGTRSPTTSSGSYQTPFHTAAEVGATADEDTNGISELDTLPSSPAAAAAERNLSRIAQASEETEEEGTITSEQTNQEETAETVVQPGHKRQGSHASTIKGESDSLDDEYSIPDPTMSPQSGSDGTIGSLHSPLASMSSTRLLKRPSFLQNRTSSQHSSVSSFTTRSVLSDGSDITLGADYALQSGGAIPAGGLTRPGIPMARFPSIGSITSSAHSSYSDSAPSWDRTRSSTGGDTTLERLEEERANANSPPETPRPISGVGGALPTDTVLAQHVRNVHVPETAVREFREKHLSPARSQTMASSSLSNRKSNLTLKEQNSKIDKLSKENFDLKLKIHFLDQALQNRSDEGVKDMINKNVQLQTDLASERKESQSLRKKVRELEKRLKAQEEGQATKQVDSGSEKSDKSGKEAELEEQIEYLQEYIEERRVEIEKLKEENFAKEADKRRLADYVKSMGENKSSEPNASAEEAMDMWKDLLNAETARREQADEDANKLREEIRQMKMDAASAVTTNNVRNVYQISKRQNVSYSTRSEADQSMAGDEMTRADSQASTVVETLKHENAELRRDLSAQTSMLTSRNRERERLQQEIEDLKINQRRHGDGRSVAGDSIFERSVSRAHNHNRAESRASGHTRITQVSESEREEYDKRVATLRDELAQIKITNQDLERELNAHLDILQNVEAENQALKEDKDLTMEDLQALQTERDDALTALQEKDEDCEELRKEAVEELEKLEQELDRKEQDFEALQQEMKTVSERVVRLEDDLNASRRQEENLEQQLEESERELERTDQKLRDTITKNERLDVQLESSQGEIAFLREEQEGDKIKIGDLEAALNNAQNSLQDEQERMAEERRQREVLDTQEKAEVQKVLDDLNMELAQFKDELRKVRKNLATKETECSTWRDRLETLEANLREALGDLNGTRSSILKVRHVNTIQTSMSTNIFQDVTKLQRDLEHTIVALSDTRQDLNEKERLLRNRDALLESTGLEARKLSELLEKERAARRADRNHFDQMQRSQQSLTRTIQQNDNRAMELEQARNSDRRKYNSLESQYVSQLLDRNNLLLALWNRLSTLCGADFMQKNSLVDEQLPSVEVISRNLTSFSRNINLAVRTVEVLVGGFRTRIRDVEKSLMKDFQTLEHAIDVRTKRIDHLEKMVAQQTRERLEAGPPASTLPPPSTERDRRSVSRSSSRSGHASRTEEISKLKNENKLLKAELQFARGTSPTRSHSHRGSVDSANSMEGRIPGVISQIPRSPQQLGSIPPRDSSSRASMTATLMRHHSTSAVEALQHQQSQRENYHSNLQGVLESPTRRSSLQPSAIQSQPLQPSEQRWIHRLKELERRLKAEREARLLDRSGARKRLEEGRLENEQLRLELEREREGRRGSTETLERERSNSVPGVVRGADGRIRIEGDVDE
jgi:predicted  nucleic acid-binding Zn-ribbon protein